MAFPSLIRRLFVAGFMAALPFAAMAADEAKVFPVRGFFYETGADSKLDPAFLRKVQELGVPAIGESLYGKLRASFGAKASSSLDASSAGNTFAVSFHVTRATGFSIDKGNGNADVIASVTAGVYFTNVGTGEILTTISRTVVSRSVVTKQSNIDEERARLFGQALRSLIDDLAVEASKQFNPVIVETKLTDRFGDLLVFDAGYGKGIQVGDQIEDSADNLVQILYSAQNYAVGVPVLASNLNLGASFQKYLAHPASGRDRPRVAVVVDAPPAGYAKDYLARLFAELLGDSAPLSLVQVNTGFSQLMEVIRSQDGARLSTMRAAERRPPGMVIRLRVLEPIAFEAATNLDFEKIRRYETFAFADVVDTTGRVIFSALGKDVIQDKITRGIGPGALERSEVSIKNALGDAAQKLAQIGEAKRDVADVVSTSGEVMIDSRNKAYPDRQNGLVLRKATAKFGNERRAILLPAWEAHVEDVAGKAQTRIKPLLPIDAKNTAINVGDIFEVQRIGRMPRSPQRLAVCGPEENLGNAVTPGLLALAGYALGDKQPGVLYDPGVTRLADAVIGPRSGFSGAIRWDMPAIEYCVQPVDRVTVNDGICKDLCERPISARYTLRLKRGDEVVGRSAFEANFNSSGYYPATASAQLKNLVASDLIDEAETLLEKAADKLVFPNP